MMAIGATGSLDLARQMAAVTAAELKALGVNLNFAPVVDVNSNPANPIIGIRSFGSDPTRVAEFGVAMMDSYRQAGILCTPKHFPGHGDTDIDSHLGLPMIGQPLEHLEQIELVPFERAIRAGAEAIMTAHVVVPALGSDKPATLAPEILQTRLRQAMGFTGVIITDSLTMGALEHTYGLGEAALLSLQAGADVLLFGADRGHSPSEQKGAYAFLLDQLEVGVLTLERVEESVRRILTLKARYGLFSNQPSDPQLDCLGSEQHRQVAQQISLDSITVVQQTSSLFPLQASQDVVVIWPSEPG
jgi:beta-N-acetylhexosaminidase